MSKAKNIWHSLSVDKVLKELVTSTKGLTAGEVKNRRKKYGSNILATSKKFSAWRLFFSQFKSALIYVLVIAGIISFIFSEAIDAYVIFAAVLLNLVIGFMQEKKANQALEKLSQVVKQEALVIRDSKEIKIPASDLVPGDVIIIKAGDRIPADARLLTADFFEVNEANLTGESWPEKKEVSSLDKGMPLADRTNMVFMGTLAVSGRAKAIVVATGLATEIGKITDLLQATEEEQTPLQKKLNKFAQNLTWIIVIVALLVFFIGLLRGLPTLEMFIVSVALAVSAIPEGLLIGVTMILTIGMQRILKHQGLVRKLISAETLGSTTLICTDKTGTVTEGEMRVTTVITSQHKLDLLASPWKNIEADKEIEKLLAVSLLCNDAIVTDLTKSREDWEIIGSPTEKALLLFGSLGGRLKDIYLKHPRLQEIPFDSQHKYMMTRHRYNSDHDLVYIKGAPEFIMDFCSYYFHDHKPVKFTDSKFDHFQKAWQELSKDGLRVLASAYLLAPKSLESLTELLKSQEFIFLGFWGLEDPVRKEAKETLEQAKAAGIKTVIITGDNKFTAKKIAAILGLEVDEESVVSGEDLLQMTDDELAKNITKIKLYARVTPADKLRIIQAWQKRGEVVAMTGDGVNDAPALKAADVGVVVNSGSDVAKEVADLILLDNNFKTIVMAVRQGRMIFANVRKVILYLLSDSFAEILIVGLGIIFGLPLPLLTAQILWINLIADGLPSLALTMEPEDKDVMEHSHRSRNRHLFGFENKFLIAVISLVAGSASLLVFHWFWTQTNDLALARTVVFTVLSLSTLLYVYSIRSVENSIFNSNPFKNVYLNLAVLFGLGLQLIAIYIPFFNKALHTVPLTWAEWRFILIFIFLIILMIEIIKYLFIIYRKRMGK